MASSILSLLQLLAILPLFVAQVAVSIATAHEGDLSPGTYEHHGQAVLHEAPPVGKDPAKERFPGISSQLFELHDTLAIMQEQYFSLWLGKWTTAIDWTAAVFCTYISATLSTLSNVTLTLDTDNEINKYFAQTTAFYYGEEAFAIRMQAYDDMLWVVLEWLESVKFIRSHASTGRHAEWHGRQFIPAFAHRARVFYELAEEGWDWRLCGGGMTWNPRLLPYKNAITNQLYIVASVSMYLHFPGDQNCSPFVTDRRREDQDDCDNGNSRQYNPQFLKNAIDGYDWLRNSGMINHQGLFTDGFHIRDYRTDPNATTCDERNDMVYTYNQGVILSGLRGMWEATGNITYLTHGYQLMDKVVSATGWYDGSKSKWHGLGANGILTEACDPSGSCNQDGQSFKGIFFHHLTAFCEPLPLTPAKPGKTFAATERQARKHRRCCSIITRWVHHNAKAALSTRDTDGRFGSWWGAPHNSTSHPEGLDIVLPLNAIDYRHHRERLPLLGIEPDSLIQGDQIEESTYRQMPFSPNGGDLNDRGRGRTVETQGSGLAVMRAMYEIHRSRVMQT